MLNTRCRHDCCGLTGASILPIGLSGHLSLCRPCHELVTLPEELAAGMGSGTSATQDRRQDTRRVDNEAASALNTRVTVKVKWEEKLHHTNSCTCINTDSSTFHRHGGN